MTKIGSEKVNNLRKIAKQLVGLTVALLLFFTATSTAFAFDSRYLETAYWQEADTTKFTIDTIGAQGNLIGSVEYFTRDESVYFRFDISEIKQRENTQSENTNGTSIFFEFSIKNNPFSDESYAFSVGENGIFNMASSEVEGKYFNIGASFDVDDAGHGLCLIAMDITDGIYTHYFDIFANINHHRYKIANRLEIVTTPPPQTTKPEKTTTQKQTTAKAQKQTTAKAQKQTTAKAQKQTTTKVTTEKTTKFKYVPDADDIKPTTARTTQSVSYDYDDKTENASTKTFSKRQIIMTSVAAVLACLAALILGLSLSRPNNKKKPRPKSEQDSDNDPTDTPPTDDYDF